MQYVPSWELIWPQDDVPFPTVGYVGSLGTDVTHVTFLEVELKLVQRPQGGQVHWYGAGHGNPSI